MGKFVEFGFAWPPALKLAVRYRREVRDEAGQGVFGHRCVWKVRHHVTGIQIEPEQVRMDVPLDARPAPAHRVLLDAIRDRPVHMQLLKDGRLYGILEGPYTRRRAGVTQKSLAMLPSPGRAMVKHEASDLGLRNRARELWNALVMMWVHADRLPDGESTLSPVGEVDLPYLQCSVPFLNEVHVQRIVGEELVMIRFSSEPSGEPLRQAMRDRVGRPVAAVPHYHLSSHAELVTDPRTLIPKSLQVTREQNISLVLIDGSAHEVVGLETRSWSFERE